MGDEQLTALENGDENLLPEPVFIKAMVRRVAGRLQLDANLLVQQLPKSGVTVSNDVPIKTPSRAIAFQGPVLKGFIVIGALVGLTVAGIAITSREVRNIPQPTKTHSALPEKAGTSALKSDHNVSESKLPLKPLPDNQDDFQISSLTPSWVSIRNSKGKTIYEGNLSEPIHYPSDEPLEIYAGRPDLVMVRTGSGAPIPLGSIENLRWHPLKPINSNSDEGNP